MALRDGADVAAELAAELERATVQTLRECELALAAAGIRLPEGARGEYLTLSRQCAELARQWTER